MELIEAPLQGALFHDSAFKLDLVLFVNTTYNIGTSEPGIPLQRQYSSPLNESLTIPG